MINWSSPLSARLSWDFILNPGSFHNSILQAKYGDLLWREEKKRGISSAWKVLCDGGKSLKHITHWEIGMRDKISILEDVQILDKSLISWPTFISTDFHMEDKINSLLDDGKWNMNILNKCFGSDLVQLISHIDIRTSDDNLQLLVWKGFKSITSQAYQSIFHGEENVMTWLKCLKLLPREYLFCWRIWRNALPTSQLLYDRKIASQLKPCYWKCNKNENLLHITMECIQINKVMDVLAKWGFNIQISSNIQQIINGNEGIKMCNSFSDIIYFKFIYLIWSERNNVVHGKHFATPTIISSYALSNCHNNPSIIKEQWGTIWRNPNYCSWYPPPPRWLKVNFGGAHLKNYEAGLGIVIRDNLGILLLVIGNSYLHWDIHQVELQALKLLSSLLPIPIMDANRIIIEGDNLNVLHRLSKIFHS